MPTAIRRTLQSLENNNFNPNDAGNTAPSTIPSQPGGQVQNTQNQNTTGSIQPPQNFDGNVPAQAFGYQAQNINTQNTPSAPPAGALQSRLDTALAERTNAAQGQEQQQGALEQRIRQLSDSTLGRGEVIKERMQQAGIGKAQGELDDLLGLVSQKTSAYEKGQIQDQIDFSALEGTGQGIPQSLVRGRQARLQTQQQLRRQSDAVELNSLNRTAELMQGRITTAQQNIKDDVELEFGDRERALNQEMKFLERIDTKLASSKAEKLQFEIQQVQQERQDRENVMNLAVNLAKNGAPQDVILAANKAKDVIEMLSIPGADKFLLSQEERMNLAIKGQALADARRAASGGDDSAIVDKMQKDGDITKLEGISELKYALNNYKETVTAAGGAKRKGRAAAQPIENSYQEVLQAYRKAKDLGQLQGGDLQLVDSAIKEATYGKGSAFAGGSSIPVIGAIQKSRSTKSAFSSIDAALSTVDKNIRRQTQFIGVTKPEYLDTTYFKTLVDPSLLGEIGGDITTADPNSFLQTGLQGMSESLPDDAYYTPEPLFND